MMALAKRNVLVFARDRMAIIFSMMAAIIVILLYLMFLRDTLISSYPDLPGMGQLMDVWVMSGILGIVPVTASAGSLQTMTFDKDTGRISDVMVTPMKRSQISGGYILGSFAIGLIMSTVTFAVSMLYLAATGCPLDVAGCLLAMVLMVPSALSGTVIIFTAAAWIGSPSAFSAFYIIVSILIGFLTGIYMPIGTMSGGMQTVAALVPATHLSSLFRRTMADASLDSVFDGAPAEQVAEFRSDMGFDLSLGGFVVDPFTSLLYVAGVTLMFFLLSILALKYRKRCPSIRSERDDALFKYAHAGFRSMSQTGLLIALVAVIAVGAAAAAAFVMYDG